MWQITVGQWIIDHRAVPETDCLFDDIATIHLRKERAVHTAKPK